MNNEEKPSPKPKKPASLNQRKVFDVMAPGKAPAASNSRGVITGHKAPVKEDMFVPSPHTKMAGDPSGKHDLMSNADKVSINPISQNLVASAPAIPKEPIPPSVREAGADEPHAPEPIFQKQDTSAEVAATAPLLGQPESEPEVPETAQPEEAPKEDELTPARVAMSHAVEELPTAGLQKELPLQEADGHSMSGDDLLAGTHAPSLDQAVISHHRHKTKWWEWQLIFFLIVILALIALNFLLDAEVLTTTVNVPHTDLIK